MLTVLQRNLDCYKFTDFHEGCAYWTSVVMHHFAQAGWIGGDMTAIIDEAIQYYYPDCRGLTTRVSKFSPGFDGVIKGTFFGASSSTSTP